MKLIVRPATLSQANEGVAKLHRHHKPVQGHRFSLVVIDEQGIIHGACIVGRPVSRELDPYLVAEVTRLVTDGTNNACSMLYGAAARACKAMGFVKIQTYILAEEQGVSLRAANWKKVRETSGGDWNHSKAYFGKRRTDQPQGSKHCYERELNNE